MSVTQVNIAKQVSKTLQSLADKCPECASKNLVHDYDTGETICGDCGLVQFGQMINKGPEWRAFTLEEKTSRSRVGPPTSYSIHDKGLTTIISQVDRDAFGRKVPPSTRLLMWRLRKWQIRSRVHSSVDRNLTQAMGELERLSSMVSISPPIKEKAALFYRKALNKGLVKGKSINAIAAATLYAACRKSGSPKTLSEIAQASLVRKKDFSRFYRLLFQELDFHMPPSDPLTYVSKIAEESGISGKTQGAAITIIGEARRKRFIAGKEPIGMAAAALYIACLQNNEKITQRAISKAAGVSEITVRNGYKALKIQLNLETPDQKARLFA